MAYEPNPNPDTLKEFPMYSEILTECGKADIALADALAGLEQREASRAARRPSREDIIRNIAGAGR